MNRSVRLMTCVAALSCASVLDAQMPPAPKTVAVLEASPLPRAHLVDLQYTELSPLTPLARLLEPTTAK
jgi:hypothetical protein